MLTSKEYDILLYYNYSNEKKEIINRVCIELQKDPFNITNYYPEVLKLNQINDIITKRKDIEFFFKDIEESEQPLILLKYPCLYRYIKNITSESLYLLSLNYSLGYDKFSEYQINLIKKWDKTQRILALNKNPSLIKIFENSTESEWVIAISGDASLILSNKDNLNNPFFRELSICVKTLVGRGTSLMHIPNPTENEIFLAFTVCDDSTMLFLLKKIVEINYSLSQRVVNLCIEKNSEIFLKIYPQSVDNCLKILDKRQNLWNLVTIVQGSKNYEETIDLLNSKKEIINLIQKVE